MGKGEGIHTHKKKGVDPAFVLLLIYARNTTHTHRAWHVCYTIVS
jgi:hypothetical protein